MDAVGDFTHDSSSPTFTAPEDTAGSLDYYPSTPEPNDSLNAPAVDRPQDETDPELTLPVDELKYIPTEPAIRPEAPDIAPTPSVHAMVTRSQNANGFALEPTIHPGAVIAPTPSVPALVSRSQNANEVALIPGQELTSSEKYAILLYFQRFKNKEFLRSHAEGLQTFLIQNAFQREEESFKKHVKEVHVSQVPSNANVVSSHVLYKVKKLDNDSLLCKARMAPHGKRDNEKGNLKIDSQTCPPIGFRILLSICSLFQWTLAKIDVKLAFLQTGSALRDVYVVPPRESPRRPFYCLLLTAAYGLVNASAEWQRHSDDFLRSLGFLQLVHVPQLFYMRRCEKRCLLAVKVVDDFLLAGEDVCTREVVKQVSKKYNVGTIVFGLGTFSFFGLNILQDTDGSICIRGDDKLDQLESHPISRLRRKESEEGLNAVELFAYGYLNGSLGFLGNAASPFCDFATSFLQQRRSNPLVKDLVCQMNMVGDLKRLGSTISFQRPIDTAAYELNILVFSDAGRMKDIDTGKLGFIAGLVVGPIKEGCIFHTLSWTSHKSHRPVRSTGAAEILAAGAGFDNGKLLAQAYRLLLNVEIGLSAAVDSKDLFNSLWTCLNSVDRSIRRDVSLSRHNFETRQILRIFWIPGKLNPADPLTKTSSQLTETLQLFMYSGLLPTDFSASEHRDSEQFLGWYCLSLRWE